MSKSDFETLFGYLTDHAPFPWQTDVYSTFANGVIPTSCRIPTGLGKTSVMTAWLIARAHGAALPRRLVYVVDRRAVVDQATDEARKLHDSVEKNKQIKLALGLRDRPLPISTLRGQFADNREWLEDPSLPAIVVGTVDMVGSRLLFEGYGVSRKMRPYHAGLLGTDSLFLVDESHLVPPFEMLLRAIAARNDNQLGADANVAALVPKFHVMSLSATGRDDGDDWLTDRDLAHPEVHKRLNATKVLAFREFDDEKQLASELTQQAWALTGNGSDSTRVIVFCNGRDVAEKAKMGIEKLARGEMKADSIEIETQLFVGARRVRERSLAATALKKNGFLAGSTVSVEKPTFLFATSAAEVGVDLDADHMVCDLVEWERMVQRLGRVNRRGGGEAKVIVLVNSKASDDVKKARDRKDTSRAANEEKLLAEFDRRLADIRRLRLPIDRLPDEDSGRNASPEAIRQLSIAAKKDGEVAKMIEDASTPPPLRPALTRPTVEAWSMTSLEEHSGRPSVAPWLRGWIDDEAQTTLVWRRYLPLRNRKAVTKKETKEFFEAAPLHLTEKLESETNRRVFPWLLKQADALLNEIQKADQDEDNNQAPRLKTDDVVGIVLGRALDVVRTFTLEELTFESVDEKRRKKLKEAFQRDLYGNSVVLDARFRGLSDDGLLILNGKKLNEPPAAIDDGMAWMETDDQEQVPIPSFRIIHRFDGGTSDNGSTDSSWSAGLRFTLSETADGEPAELLLVQKWKHQATSEDSRSTGTNQQLSSHQEWAAREAENIAVRLDLPPEYTTLLKIVARLHDEGKQSDRWQRAFTAPNDGTVYAKTRGPIKFTLLDGYRHEFGSLPYVEADEEFQQLDGELQDLGLHLVAAHHGFGRPIIRVDGCDDAPPSMLEARAREVALRFERMLKRWGPWGLAWWESLLRAADHKASRDNEEQANVEQLEVSVG